MNTLSTISSKAITPTPIEVDLAMQAFQRTLDSAIAIAAKYEDAKTERALISAKKEIEIAAIEAATQRGIANDRNIHERRMQIIQIIGNLLMANTQSLNSDIMEKANFLLQVLREEQ